MRIPIQRALLSVSDKSGIVDLARCLAETGCQLLSTGNTGRLLREAGLTVTDITDVTGNPEAFGGRMKTISFEVASALLFDRERDLEEARRLGITPIDMVVCNLYPFERRWDEGADLDRLVEEIDIGGPTMIRAAAKNFRWVAVVTDRSQYGEIEQELKANQGALSLETRFKLMRAAFNRTADYDSAIAMAMDERADTLSLRLAFVSGTALRYGENAHQSARFYRERGASDSIHDLDLLSGKQLSFNNIVDIHAALSAVADLERSACAVVKHTNPCGLAESSRQRTALEAAWAGDPVSAFGSVIGFNRRISRSTVEFLALDSEDRRQCRFVEVLVAPDFDEEALVYLRLNRTLRVVRWDPARCAGTRDLKFLPGALLVQQVDRDLLAQRTWVTELRVVVDDDLLNFGLVAVRQLKSNAIALVRRTGEDTLQLLGMGAGQPNRVTSTRLAVERAREILSREYEGPPDRREAWIDEQMGRCLLASDAFFPFPDNIEVLARAGVRTVVQPGGSIRDSAVIRRCNELSVAMMMTGTRHFRH